MTRVGLLVCACVLFALSSSAAQIVECSVNNSLWGFAWANPDSGLVSGVSSTLTATPSTGYHFVQWVYVDSGSTFSSNPLVISYDTNRGKNDVLSYRADFAPNHYVLTFDSGEGTVSPSSKDVVYGESYGELPSAVRGGYTFEGWTNSNGKAVTSTTTNTVASDQQLGAKYRYDGDLTVQIYNDPLSEGAGTLVPAGNVQCVYGASLRLQAIPSTGSVFTRWSDGITVADRWITVTTNAEYLARYDLEQFEVLFMYVGSDGTSRTSSQSVKYRQSATVPSADIINCWPRHTFTAWDSDEYKCVERPLTINAAYRLSSYAISLKGNGATSGSMVDLKVSCDSTTNLPSCLYSKPGYHFVGWNRDASASAAEYKDGAEVVNLSETEGAIVNLYAVWAPNEYTVEFDPNGGSGEMSPQAFRYDEQKSLSPCTFLKSGQDFVSWTCSSNSQIYADQAVVSNLTTAAGAVVTMTANWSKTWYVRFDGNGATNADVMTVQRLEEGEKSPLSKNAFLRPGYSFSGWSGEPNGSVQYVDGEKILTAPVPYGQTKVLYAVWKPNSYSVIYDPNGGVGAQIVTNVKYDASFKLEANVSHLTASLRGWSREKDGAVDFLPGTVVSNLVESGSVTLYAQWNSKLNALSIAANCKGLIVDSVVIPATEEVTVETTPWTANTKASFGACVQSGFKGYYVTSVDPPEIVTDGVYPSDMAATIVGPGILTFEWVAEGNPDIALYFCTNSVETFIPEICRTPTLSWTKETVTITTGVHTVVWRSSAVPQGYDFDKSDGAIMYVRNITWVPVSPTPTPQDARDISKVSCSSAGLMLMFEDANAAFDYILRGTNDLGNGAASRMTAWPEIRRTNGVGTIRFEIPADPLRPNMFYYLETATRMP